MGSAGVNPISLRTHGGVYKGGEYPVGHAAFEEVYG
jgi:hypothetical protein